MTDDLKGILDVVASRGLRTRASSSPYHHLLRRPLLLHEHHEDQVALLSHGGDLRQIRNHDARRRWIENVGKRLLAGREKEVQRWPQ